MIVRRQDVTHEEKVEHFEADLRSRGFWIINACPPAMRVLWRFGYQIPPPYFLPFGIAWLTSGTGFGLGFGVLGGLFVYFTALVPLAALIISAAIAGSLFGFFMALFWFVQRRRLGLPSWREYPRAQPAA